VRQAQANSHRARQAQANSHCACAPAWTLRARRAQFRSFNEAAAEGLRAGGGGLLEREGRLLVLNTSMLELR
jgi:hypothetical protein